MLGAALLLIVPLDDADGEESFDRLAVAVELDVAGCEGEAGADGVLVGEGEGVTQLLSVTVPRPPCPPG